MSDKSIFQTGAARDLPEKELWDRVWTAHMKRRNALDELRLTIRIQGKDLNGEQLGALFAAFEGMSRADDGAVERVVSEYLAGEAAKKLKGESS